MEKKIFILVSIILPMLSLLFIVEDLHEVTIFFQGFSIIVCSFLYKSEDKEENRNFRVKSILYLIVIGILLALVLSIEPRIDNPFFSLVAVFFSVIHAKEVRKSRGWPPLIDLKN